MTDKFFGWQDFDLDESDEIPDKFIATVGVWEGKGDDAFLSQEVFTLVHRHSEGFPIYGEVAENKREDAAALSNILNIARGWEDEAIERHPQEALDAFSDIVEKVRRILDRNS